MGAQVLRPDFTKDEASPTIDIEQMPLTPTPAVDKTQDMVSALAQGAVVVFSFLAEHKVAIKNTALLIGGTYLVIKGPPILARSFAETMHYMREGWHGKGYADRWLEEKKDK